MALPIPSFMPTTYLVALDDSGQKGIRLPTSQSFALGGIVLPARRLAGLQSDWRAVMELEQGKEAKVPELLAKFGDIVGGEPNFNGRAVLSVLLRQWGALPVFVHAKKAETTMTLTTRRGGLAIDLKGARWPSTASLCRGLAWQSACVSSWRWSTAAEAQAAEAKQLSATHDRQAEELRLVLLTKLGLSADADNDAVKAAWLKRFTTGDEAVAIDTPPLAESLTSEPAGDEADSDIEEADSRRRLLSA